MQVLLTPGGVDVITVSTDGTARVWDMEIGDCVLLLAGHSGPLTDVAASADGALLLTGAADGTARCAQAPSLTPFALHKPCCPSLPDAVAQCAVLLLPQRGPFPCREGNCAEENRFLCDLRRWRCHHVTCVQCAFAGEG